MQLITDSNTVEDHCLNPENIVIYLMQAWNYDQNIFANKAVFLWFLPLQKVLNF